MRALGASRARSKRAMVSPTEWLQERRDTLGGCEAHQIAHTGGGVQFALACAGQMA